MILLLMILSSLFVYAGDLEIQSAEIEKKYAEDNYRHHVVEGEKISERINLLKQIALKAKEHLDFALDKYGKVGKENQQIYTEHIEKNTLALKEAESEILKLQILFKKLESKITRDKENIEFFQNRLLGLYQLRLDELACPILSRTEKEEIESSVLKAGPNAFELTKKFISDKRFAPISKMTHSGLEFWFSKVLDDGGGKFAIMYVKKEDGKIYPRLLYKSNSEGVWRSSPAYGIQEKEHFWKGDYLGRVRHHYTQTTALFEEFGERLYLLEKNHGVEVVGEGFLQQFRIRELSLQGIYTLTGESQRFSSPQVDQELHEFQKYQPGRNFSRNLTTAEVDMSLIPKTVEGTIVSAKDYFKSLDSKFDSMPGFVPTFREENRIRKYNISHTLLSEGLKKDVEIEVFSGRLGGEDIHWHMARDKNGRVWIDRIVLANARINSYGMRDVFIDSGLLTNKPLEYDEQVSEFNKRDAPMFAYGYRNITGIIAELKPVREYIAYKNRL